jgi:hypothetical protein
MEIKGAWRKRARDSTEAYQQGEDLKGTYVQIQAFGNLQS